MLFERLFPELVATQAQRPACRQTKFRILWGFPVRLDNKAAPGGARQQAACH